MSTVDARLSWILMLWEKSVRKKKKLDITN